MDSLQAHAYFILSLMNEINFKLIKLPSPIIITALTEVSRVASAYFFLGSILITGSVHTDRGKVSTKPLIDKSIK